MKTLLYKEFRETFRLAVLGALVLAGMLGTSYYTYSSQMQALLLGETNATYPLQPLHGPEVRGYLLMVCAVFGGLLGWRQGRSEASPGLWGFLVHRPASAERLFAAKAVTGLGLYAAAAGLPLLCYLVWAVTPGHVAAPYEGRLLFLPLLSYLAGVPFYFAGMLVGWRRARWFGSRLLPVGAAVVITALAMILPEFWLAVICVLAGAALLAAGASGAFRTHGVAAGQRVLSRAATAVALGLGWGVVLFFAGTMLGDVFSRVARERTWSYYTQTEDGEIYQVTHSSEGGARITDLKGQVVPNPETHGPLSFADLQSRLASSETVYMEGPASTRRLPWTYQGSEFFRQYRATPASTWFYLPALGRLLVYDTVSRRYAGSLGPEGFARTLKGGGDRFTREADPVFATATTLFRVNVHERTARPFFTVPDGPLLGLSVLRDQERGRYTIATTSNTVYILSADGQTWSTPYRSGYPQYDRVRVQKLAGPGQFSVWFEPNDRSNRLAGFTLPTRVQQIPDSDRQASLELPGLKQDSAVLDPEHTAQAMLLPPTALMAFWHMTGNPGHPGWKVWFQISAAVSALGALPIGLWWIRRYRAGAGAQLG
ncbi:MAG TPA: hypothetical protein VN673_09670, partial [Clostridia bacterium]|nr:hypothetical protein [Clostridia bacterium]